MSLKAWETTRSSCGARSASITVPPPPSPIRVAALPSSHTQRRTDARSSPHSAMTLTSPATASRPRLCHRSRRASARIGAVGMPTAKTVSVSVEWRKAHSRPRPSALSASKAPLRSRSMRWTCGNWETLRFSQPSGSGWRATITPWRSSTMTRASVCFSTFTRSVSQVRSTATPITRTIRPFSMIGLATMISGFSERLPMMKSLTTQFFVSRTRWKYSRSRSEMPAPGPVVSQMMLPSASVSQTPVVQRCWRGIGARVATQASVWVGVASRIAGTSDSTPSRLRASPIRSRWRSTPSSARCRASSRAASMRSSSCWSAR